MCLKINNLLQYMETGVAKYNGLCAIAKKAIIYLYAFRVYKKWLIRPDDIQ